MSASPPFRSRPLAAFLALVGGLLGAHRWYLGARAAWLPPLIALPALAWTLGEAEFLRAPGAHVAGLVWVEALLEAIYIALRPDAAWDARWNPDNPRRSHNGVLPVLLAIASLILAAIVLMSVLALSFETLFSARPGLTRS